MERNVVLVTHPAREGAAALAAEFAGLLAAAGIGAVVPADQAVLFAAGTVEPRGDATLFTGVELVVVLGGDGTILGGAERARGSGVPLLGLNLGHVGFLAEAEEDELAAVARAVAGRSYRVEQRLAIEVEVISADGEVWRSWALNEASLEKGEESRMLDFLVSIDGDRLSRWGADGLVLATPTGSTAYAWPDVEALLVVPVSAHALFSRPLVVSPTSEITVDLLERPQRATVWCDGRRRRAVGSGDTLKVRRSADPVPLARLRNPAFTARLVGKFHLPVQGWRRPPQQEGQQ
jgi:NAD+ kinase